jgi:DNA-directed RNA polymerase specialized sigma subunit
MATFAELENERKKKKADPNEPFARWKADPRPEVLRESINSMDDVIKSSIRRYVGTKSSPIVDQRARLLAAKALQSYDPKKGANLKTHIANQLRSLQRLAPDITDPLPPPERFRRHQREIMNASELLSEQLGREVTDEEIAELTSLPPARVSKVRSRMRARIPLSAFEEADEGEGDELVAGKHDDYDDWLDAVYHDLGNVDRLILMHRVGYRNADLLSTKEIAERLGMSPAAVSQRASRIQKRLDEFHASSS